MTASMAGIRFRTMERDEAQTAIDWAAREGWNPGLSDAGCFYDTDPAGFFCAEADGRIIGTISVVNYDEAFSFAGLFIVDPGYRGRGIGMELYRHALKHAGSRIVGGDGVLSMVPKYERTGGLFLHSSNARYAGIGGGGLPPGLLPVQEANFEQLARFDAEHFPAARDRFLRCWIHAGGHSGLACTGEDGAITGYGVRRACGEGYKIGPLFARNRAVAEAILDGLVAGIPGAPYYLDIPVSNPDAAALAKDRGMTPVFFTARMYSTRRPPALPLNEIFGITTFELG